MHGTLCIPGGVTPSTVMVLIAGATYNHVYWDFPYRPQIYNFRQAMNDAGYATYVVDALGTGQSSRPPSALVTATADAQGVHRSIRALRSGQIGGIRFAKVILGGHSLGSGIATLEAGTYHDENAVLLTGLTHQVNLLGTAIGFASLYPALLDPAFAGKGYDPGYLTTEPGTRARAFYAAPTTDPAVVAEDEATKDVFSAAIVPDAAIGLFTPYSALIRTPVLLADGQLDNVFCSQITDYCRSAAALKRSEAPFFAGSPCLQTYLLPGAGHDINLATDTQAYQQAVWAWADEFIGSGPSPPPGRACP